MAADETKVTAQDDKRKQIVLRLSPLLWESINQMAADEFRSLNGQIEYILTQAVRNSKTKKDILAEGNNVRMEDVVAEKTSELE